MTKANSASVGAIILAAGGSSRLGKPKQLLAFQGQTLLRRTVETVQAAGCAPLVVVVGSHRNQIEAELAGLQARVTRNEQWRAGLSTSVRAGIAALQESTARAAILLPCDQPLLSADVLEQIIERYHEGASIVVCEYANIWGAPMLFERTLWPHLQVLAGDRGAQQVARDNAYLVRTVPFDGGALDIDTEDDYETLFSSSA